MKFTLKIMTILLIAGLAFNSAYGQSEDDKVGSVGFNFLNLGYSARATGMGTAYTAMANDAQAVFGNPGGLALVKNISLNFTHTSYLVDTKYEAISGAYTIEDIGTFAVGIVILDYGDIIETEFPSVGDTDPRTGNILKATDFSFGVSFARKLSDNFSMGGTVKYFKEDLTGITASGFAFDVGTIFDLGYRNIKIGAAMTNFGPEAKFSGNGFDGQDVTLPQSFRIGFSMDSRSYNDNENLLIVSSVDLLKNADTVQRLALGTEITISKTLMLRGGYILGFDEAAYSFGAGVHVAKFKIDYSVSKLDDFDTTDIQRFSVGIEL